MKTKSLLIVALTVLMIFAVSQQLLAQECTQAIQELLINFSSQCTGLGAESACTPNQTSVNLTELESLSTTGNDSESLGLALLNVHANVPLALSETGLRMMLVGDATLENLVPAESAFVPSAGLTVVTFVGSNLRAFPSTDGRIVASAAPGTELLAYGLSSDSQWLLVLNDNENVWINRHVVTVQGEGNIADLPLVRGVERSLMQRFKFTASSSVSDCAGSLPSMLVIQGPAGFSSLIEVNGVEIRFSSTIVLMINAENQMQLTVLEGGAQTNNLSMPAGFTMFMPLTEEGLASNSGWTGLRPINGIERSMLSGLQTMPQDDWFTTIEVPSEAEVAQTLANLNASSIGQTVAGPASSRANCSSFRPTSPLAGLGNRPDQAFYWDGASGANGYRVNIYNESGNLVNAVDIASNSTTLVTNTTVDGIGGGATFAWEVQALVDGQIACTTGRATVQRDAATFGVGQGGGVQASPTPCGWQGC